MPDQRPARTFDLSLPIAERDQMEREIGRLTVDQRAVMVLHIYLDLPLTEAADILDIPVGTAKSRLHYGLRALCESMIAERERSAARVRERTA